MVLQARSLTLRPVQESDFPILTEWRNSPDYLATCTASTRPSTIAEMQQRVARRLFQFMIVHEKRGVIGTIFSTRVDLARKTLFVTTYLSGPARGLGYAPIALSMVTAFCFQQYQLDEVQFDVYLSNTGSEKCFRGGEKLGFEIVGTFQERREKVNRYRFQRERLPLLKSFLQRLTTHHC